MDGIGRGLMFGEISSIILKATIFVVSEEGWVGLESSKISVGSVCCDNAPRKNRGQNLLVWILMIKGS